MNGDIYIVDRCNQRVQVFTSGRIYKATLGILDETGIDNQHFNYPWGVFIDQSGKVYVVDTGNERIQIFNQSHVYQRTLGMTGECGQDFNHFCMPHAVTVDTLGHIFVADVISNDRIQVFDASGAYLTTIGGN